MATPTLDYAEKRRAILSEISQAEHAIEELCKTLSEGRRIGELLQKKVVLQRRIQKLREEERMLKNEKLSGAVALYEKKKAAAVAQRANAYKPFISGTVPRRSCKKAKKSEEESFANFTNHGAEDDAFYNVDGKDDLFAGDAKLTSPVPDLTQTDVPAGLIDRLCPFSDSESDHNCVSGRNDRGAESNLRRSNDYCTGSHQMMSDTNGEEEGGVVDKLWITGPNFLQTVKLLRERGVDGELQMEAMRHARMAKMQATENRQIRSMKRLKLVEDMFAKAVERRLRAMRKIAIDPPADRLIGNCAVQHIPISMLPGQLRQTALAFAGDGLQGPAGLSGEGGLSLLGGGDANKRFFLTDVDAVQEAPTASTTVLGKLAQKERGSLGGDGAKEEEQDLDGAKEEELDGVKKESSTNNNNIEEEKLLNAWYELGYTAVYLPATKRFLYPGETGVKARSCTDQIDLNAWRRSHLTPLPPLHLVQKRLPPVSKLLTHDSLKPVKQRRRQLPSLREKV